MVKTYIKRMYSGRQGWRRGFMLPLKGLLITGAFLMALLMTPAVFGQQSNIAGFAPVMEPPGGFNIQGDIFAPNDWFPTESSNTSLFEKIGAEWVAKYPMTFWQRDGWGGTDLTVFTSSNKIDDNPNTYTWGPGSVPNKNEIQNAWVHFTYGDPAKGGTATDLWAVFAADREVTNGSNYVDFEFLQNRLYKNGTLSGTFTSEGPDGGRTLGDILVTIEFTQGGSQPNAVIRKWSVSGTGYEYIEFTAAEYLELKDNIFIISNPSPISGVPYDVYGSNPGSYLVNQWAEGALNLTKAMGDYLAVGKCGGISTVFIRTRTSGSSSSSELKDFPVDPIWVGAIPDPPVAHCPGDVDIPVCTPKANILEAYETWKGGFTYESGVEPVVEDVTFPALPEKPECAGFTATVLYTVTDYCGKVSTCSSSFTVTPDLTAPVIADLPDDTLPECNAEWPASLVTTWTDNCGDINGLTSGVVTSTEYEDVITTGCIQTRKYNFVKADKCGNLSVKSTTVSRKWDKAAPVIAGAADITLDCNIEWPVKLTTTWTDNCGVGGMTSGSLDSDAGVPVSTGGCTETRLYTFMATDDCGNPASKTTTVTRKWDKTKPVVDDAPDYTLPGCNPDWPASLTTNWSDNCGAGGLTSGTMTSDAGVDGSTTGCVQTRIYTFTKTDDCGNTATQSTTVSRKWDKTAPVLSGVPQGAYLGCNPTPKVCGDFNVTALDACDGAVTVTCAAGQVTGEDCMKSQTFTWSAADACGNPVSATVTFTWKVDTEAPKPDIVLTDLEFECGVPVNVLMPNFTDNCDGPVTSTCTVVGFPGEDCGYFDYPTGETEICFYAVDKCGNSTTICIKVTVNPCKEFCTYTQGFFGSQKGTACNLEEQVRGDVFTAGLLEQGDLVLGCPSLGNTVTFTPGTAELIRSILPGGKAASVISGACVPTLTNKSCLSLSKQGRLNNQLLAQTLVLGLNLRIIPELGNLQLVAGKMLATQDKKACDSPDGVDMVCSPVYSTVTPTMIECYQKTTDPYDYYTLPAVVLCYMEANGYTMNVAGLYKLANEALGQKMTLPVMCGGEKLTLTAISSAVDMLNNAFDECRIFAGWVEEKFECPNPCGSGSQAIGSAPKSAVVVENQATALKIYPNPFSSKVTFEFVPVTDAHAQLEIQNVLGQRIATLMSKNVEKGVLTRIEYQPENLTSGILIYRLLLDDQVQTGRLMYNNK